MLRIGKSLGSAVVTGFLLLLPIYLTMLLLWKALKSVGQVVRPIAGLLPAWFPAEHVLSLLVVLIFCFCVGLGVRTPMGHRELDRVENAILQKIPGYTLLRSFTRQLAGESQEHIWKPALVEIEEALAPAFIIEELDDGSFTVFVPAAPTPFTGSIYVLSGDRVHVLDVPFAAAVKAVTRWGSGTKDLMAAMREPIHQR